jgi:hypothetical protein
MSEIQICCTYMRTTLTHDDFASISMLEAQETVHSLWGPRDMIEFGLVGAHAATYGFSTLHNTYLDILGM